MTADDFSLDDPEDLLFEDMDDLEEYPDDDFFDDLDEFELENFVRKQTGKDVDFIYDYDRDDYPYGYEAD